MLSVSNVILIRMGCAGDHQGMVRVLVAVIIVSVGTPAFCQHENDSFRALATINATGGGTLEPVQGSRVLTCFTDRSKHKNCIQVVQAELNGVYGGALNQSLEFRFIYTYNKPYQTFAVRVESWDVRDDHPILFVVRQEKAAMSWQLPFVLESSSEKHSYRVFRRTLCPDPSTRDPSGDRDIVVDVSTSSLTNVNFNINVSIDNNFNVGMDDPRELLVTPSESRFFKFSFPHSVTQVAVKSQSSDDVCLTLSIQHPQCPAFDTIYNVEYEGFRQTMTGQSTMIVQKDQFPNGFYIVFIVNIDDKKCRLVNQNKSSAQPSRSKQVVFNIRKTISVEEFQTVVFTVTLSVYAVFIVVVLAACVVVEILRRNNKNNRLAWSSIIRLRQPAKLSSKQVSFQSVQDLEVGKRSVNMDSSVEITVCSMDLTDRVDDTSSDHNNLQHKKDKKPWRRVSEMSRHQPDFYNKKSKRFVSELCIIAVFYAIPVGQLVYNHKTMMITTGDQDMCYYNFACAYPYQMVMDFTDFNHFFSNIGYIILGSIFMLITKRRDYIHSRTVRPNSPIKEHGIPPHYGLFYAMGGALTVEGILSACYHICPTRVNFQFDTAFMYVIAALCTLKLYHARHADVNAKSYTVYIVLSLIVLLGAGTPIHAEYYFKIAFTFLHLIACLALSLDIYYMGHCEWKHDQKLLQEHLSTCCTSRPLYLERLTLVVVGTLCNLVFAVFELVANTVDFNTHILAVFMINLFVYSTFYVVMKSRKRECITRSAYPFLYLAAAVTCWITGMCFFLQKAAKWEHSPAESRMLNKECIVADVYDTHDLWHFLSSTGLFLFFMFLLTLDDDVESKSRRELPVF